VAAAVVELDALADPVRASAEDHHLLRVGGDRRLAELLPDAARRLVVGRVVVCLALDARHGDREPSLDAPKARPLRADVLLGDLKKLRKVLVAEAVLLRLDEHVVGQEPALVHEDELLFLHKLAHLVDEVRLNARTLEYLVVGRSLAEGLVHLEVALGVRNREHRQEFVQGPLVEVLHETEPGPAALERADRLLESLLVGLAYRHHLADGLHLRAELVLDGAELLKGPARELQDDVVAVRRILLERSVAPVGDLVERHARRELGRDERDGEARRLRGERRGARGARVDLDDNDAPGLRVVGELHVRAADDADRLDDLEGVALEPLFKLLGDGEERRRAIAVARVHADGVDVLDETDRDHLVLGVADDLDLELLPVEDRLLDEALAGERGVESASADRAELLDVVAESAASAAHGVGGPDDDRIADLPVDELYRLLDGVDDPGARRLYAELVHRRLEDLSILAALDRVQVDADHLHAILLEDAILRKLHGKVEARLSAEVREDRVGSLLLDYLLEPRLVQGLDVGRIGHDGVRHYGGGVGIYEHNLVSASSKGFACLGAGIVELACLSDNDGT